MNFLLADQRGAHDRTDPLMKRVAFSARWTQSSLSNPSLRKGLLSLIDQAVLSATSFITGVVIARLTSQTELGVYYLALSLVLFARGFQTEVITGPYVIYHHRHRDQHLASYTGSVLVHVLVFCLLVSAASVGLFLVLWLTGRAAGWGLSVGIVIPAMILLLWRACARDVTMAHLRVGSVLIIDVVYATVVLGALAMMVQLNSCSAVAVFSAMGIGAALVGVGWVWANRGMWSIDRTKIITDWWQNWSFGRWSMAGYLLVCTTPYLMPWIVAAARDQATAGLYGACGTLAGIANMFVMGLGNFIAPKTAATFAEGGPVALRDFVRKVIALYVGSIGLFVVIAAIAGEYAMVFIFGEQYAGSGVIVTVCTMGVLASAIGWATGSAICAMDRPRATFLPDLVALIVTIVAAGMLVTVWGALGAAVTALVGATVAALLKFVNYQRLLREKIAETT